jgi:hypothetical protein
MYYATRTERLRAAIQLQLALECKQGIMIGQVQFWESCETHTSEKSPMLRLARALEENSLFIAKGFLSPARALLRIETEKRAVLIVGRFRAGGHADRSPYLLQVAVRTTEIK